MQREAVLAAALCAAAGSAASAQNVGARLLDGPAVLDYTTGGVGGLPTSSSGASGNVPMNFQVGGAPGDLSQRQVFSGNWFYRVQGDSRGRHFANAGTRTLSGSNEVEWQFPQMFTGGASPIQVSDLSAEMGFQVNSTGADTAFFCTWVCLHNAGSTPIDVDLFFAVDIDLGATGAGVGPFSTVMGTMTNTVLNDFIPDVNPGGLGPADLAAVMQWRETVFPGMPGCFPRYVGIGLNGAEPIVPAPGAAALRGRGGEAREAGGLGQKHNRPADVAGRLMGIRMSRSIAD